MRAKDEQVLDVGRVRNERVHERESLPHLNVRADRANGELAGGRNARDGAVARRTDENETQLVALGGRGVLRVSSIVRES